MRDPVSGALAPGLRVVDMGRKTIANDLDNARLKFSAVFVPRSAMLDKFAAIDDEGRYVQVGAEPMRIEVIGQRLLTGRLAIAESAVVAVRQLFLKTQSYAEGKVVNGVGGPLALAELPHLAQLFKGAHERLSAVETFCASVEARLSVHLRAGTIPGDDLVEAIGVCKVRGVELATELEHCLEQEVDGYTPHFIYFHAAPTQI